MKWPRGKYNGQKIIGVELKIKFNLQWWAFAVRWKYNNAVFIGPFRIELGWVYEMGKPPNII